MAENRIVLDWLSCEGNPLGEEDYDYCWVTNDVDVNMALWDGDSWENWAENMSYEFEPTHYARYESPDVPKEESCA